MLHFSRVKTAVIAVVCLLGILLSLPNLIPPGALPSWLPQPRLHLGLDLKGGSYLLMEVDTEALIKERLEATQDGVRAALREMKIAHRDMQTGDGALTVTLVDPNQIEAARAVLSRLGVSAGGPSEFTITELGAKLRLTFTEAALRDMTKRAVEQSREIIHRRIDQTGVNEPVVAQQGAKRILVQLPGVDDPARIKRLVGETAKMTFHLTGEGTTGRAAPPGMKWLPSVDSASRGQSVLVRNRVELDGAHLTDARPGTDARSGGWVVNFQFDGVGARRFADITTANVGRPFAIVLDGKVVSSPVIREPITGGSGQISGNFTANSANDLAILLRAGALPAPLTIVEERTVGPDLGADAIQAGLIACIVGFALVVGYMTLSYGLFGVFANIALMFNLFLTLAALSLLEAALTLPGIAGILLTLGMSVDANILINERIREETAKGASPTAAMETGFRRAFSTILDANVTSLIKMALLYSVGTGTVRGFAVTISLGILTSMFTATLVARLLMATWLRRRRPKALPAGWLHLVPQVTRIRFMKGRYAGIALSVLISLASIGLFFAPGLKYGVDFAGGTAVEIRMAGAADFATLREDLSKLGLGPVALQQFGAPTDVLIRLEKQSGGDTAQQEAVRKVQATLEKDFPGTQIRRVESVGGSVSSELFSDGMMALGLAGLAMLVYIWFRFEWQFGVGAVVTMALDVTKTLGFYALTGFQFNLTAIAAILTIMGYSINDKVVVYDRVRENLRLYRRMPLRELIDKSINETLSRTIGTSLSIFLATLPLALLAGEGLREFAWTLLFGVVLATSSSIFIAAPILLFLGEKRLRRSPEDEGEAPDIEAAPAR